MSASSGVSGPSPDEAERRIEIVRLGAHDGMIAHMIAWRSGETSVSPEELLQRAQFAWGLTHLSAGDPPGTATGGAAVLDGRTVSGHDDHAVAAHRATSPRETGSRLFAERNSRAPASGCGMWASRLSAATAGDGHAGLSDGLSALFS